MSIPTRSKMTFAALLILLAAGSPLHADDGDGDPTFGDSGLLAVGWNGGAYIARGRAAASLADGSLLVAGEVATGVGNGAFGIVKLGPTGLLNIGFGTGGFTRFAFSDDVNLINNLGDVVELPGGSILLAGSTQVDGPVVPEDLIYVPAVAKLTSAGDLDPSFGTGGRKIVSLPWPSENIYFQRPIHQPDGKLLFAGSCSQCPDNEAQYFPTFLRLTTEGEPDTTFSGDGWLTPASGPISNVYAWDLALDGAGRILVFGTTGTDFAVVRLTANGVVDTSFGGGDGLVTWPKPVDATSWRFAVDANSGAIFVAWTYIAGPSSQYTAVSRLSPGGVLDPTYGGDGATEIVFGTQLWVLDLTVQSDGKLVGVGMIRGTAGAHQNFVLVRLLADGTLDPSFDGNGVRNVEFGLPASGDDQAVFATLAGGRLVAVGTVFTGTPHFGVSRSVSAHIFTDGFERGSAEAWLAN